MDMSPHDVTIHSGTHAPFALLVGSAMSDDALEALMRRMGLRPEAVRGAGLPLRLTLGPLHAIIDRAGAAALDLADPEDRATSSLGTRLPEDWRDAGARWTIAPEMPTGSDARLQLCDFFKMIVLLIDAFDAQHIFWSPAQLWTDALQFRGAIAEMQASGMPPVLHLIAFRRREDSTAERVATRGLIAFAGQELEAEIPAGWDMAAMVKRLARLALDIMLNGPVARAQRAPGLERGETVVLTPRHDEGGRPPTVLVEFSVDR